MRRRDLDYLVIIGMVLSGLYVTVTGIVSDMFGLHQFIFHSLAGYVCAGLICCHVALNWSRVVAYFSRLPDRVRGSEGRPERRQRSAPSAARREVLIGALSAAGGFLLGWLIPDRHPELPADARDIGELYHEWSKPGGRVTLPVPDWGGRPAAYKTYPDAERIPLPSPTDFTGLSVEEALEERRSVRDYADRSLSREALSRLVWAAQGITEERLEFRSAPSAGALYPIETYPVVNDVSDLDPGVYHYAVREHALELLQRGSFGRAVMEAGLYQTFLGQAQVCFVLSAILQRTRWRYQERAYRYILMEAGHIAQNIYLEAVSMGLGACAVAAFRDEKLNELLGVDGVDEAALYIMSVGERA